MSHIAPLTFKVRTTLPAYRIVAADTVGSNYAILPSSAAVSQIGITLDTVKDVNQAIPVAFSGIAKLQFNDTMSTGSLIACDGGGLGLGVKHVDITAGSFVIGVLIGPNVTTTGTVADVLIRPIFKAIP